MKAPAVTPPALQLVLGEEELLVERAVQAAVETAKLADPTAEMTRVKVTDLTGPELAELVSPSLFAERRVIVLDGAQDAGKDIA
ncbi:MAG: DNA polymerase III subunit delta, partial [Pseudonocardiaceae bacterium]|nr:DNA polymerase III subunit delta [Pseudonocardiaceae bacterium]